MTTERTYRLLPAAVATAALLHLAACDQWALLVNSDGVLSISITSDGRTPQQFRIRVRQIDGSTRELELPPSGSVTLSGAAGSAVELTLLAPDGCGVAAPNPRTVSIPEDETVSVGFQVHCGSHIADAQHA